MPSRFTAGSDLTIRSVMRRNVGPPENRTVREPTRPGVRCDLSDLLIEECACRVHKKKEVTDDRAEPLDLDFS